MVTIPTQLPQNAVRRSVGKEAPAHTQPLELRDLTNAGSRASPHPAHGHPCAPVVTSAVQSGFFSRSFWSTRLTSIAEKALLPLGFPSLAKQTQGQPLVLLQV